MNLVELDALEATIIVDNELDPLSTVAPDTVELVSGSLGSLAASSPHGVTDRGCARRELRMEDLCCSAHGLSVLITATKDGKKHSVLFDAGPEEEVWEKNARRLRADLASVEWIQLSHWHRDHSGGLPRAIRLIETARAQQPGRTMAPLVVDVHPSRPAFRGLAVGDSVYSLEADPTFDELERAGAAVATHAETHTVLDDYFLVSGEIPRVTAYETGLKHAMRYEPELADWVSDERIADERFLMCRLKDKGIVMFTGCSHAGVVNAAKHAVDLAGRDVPLHAVVGGFHLAASDAEQIARTVADLRALDPAVLLPGHCSGWRAKFAIEKSMPGCLVPCTVGSKIRF